jgi:hypothetical protein
LQYLPLTQKGLVEKMAKAKEIIHCGEREEARISSDFPRAYLTIRMLEKDGETAGALLIDRSDTGLGIVTSLNLPLSTKVEICGDEFTAIAEVVNVCEDYDEWDWSGKVRMSLRFIN